MLFGCLFVLQGYAMIQPMSSPKELLFWLVVVVGAIALAELIFVLFSQHPSKPALLASICVIFFFFFGDWRQILGHWLPPRLATAKWTLPATGIVFTSAFAWVLWSSRAFDTTRRYLNAVASLLIIIPCVRIARGPSTPVFPPVEMASAPMALGSHPPDIYFILTDAYTSPESLKTYWGYDNSGFVNWLAGRGFHVVKGAHGNSTFTPVCLSTYLSMNYPAAPPSSWPSVADTAYYSAVIGRSAVPARLKASGYDLRAYSIFDVAGEPHFYYVPRVTDPTLGNSLFERTVLGYGCTYFNHLATGDVNLKLFDLLPRIAAERSVKPKFVYVHIMMPHFPFLFDAQGHRVKRGLRQEDERPEDYLGQLIYENTLLTNAVAGILKNSPAPPIIVLQGDHGFREVPGPHRFEEASTILNALYLPGSKEDWFYPGMTPVNTFRLIFNHYFGQHYDYVPDIIPTNVSPFVVGPNPN
ncbi:MAG TPA: hypothetical protein VGO59_11420 [Verrucomicrobiae bacterium]